MTIDRKMGSRYCYQGTENQAPKCGQGLIAGIISKKLFFAE